MAASSLLAQDWAAPAAPSVSAAASTRRGVARARSEMLEVLLEELNAAGLDYCVLSGFQRFPEVIESDVDFMVRPPDAARVAPLLQQVAKRRGARLVQAIQHETGACYFVIAEQMEDSVVYLHPDCTTDYRRDGRLWLRADDLLRRRQRHKTFFVPATGDEFQYYLVKKVLKRNVSDEHMLRLWTLYTSCPEECCQRLRQFWPEKTCGAVVSAIVRRDLAWMRSHLPELSAELKESAPVERWWPRAAQRLREWRRWVSRAVNPTGLSIAVRGGSAPQRKALAAALEQNLRPAFRRARILAEDEGSGLSFAAWQWLAKVRSTLVVRKRTRANRGWLSGAEISFDASATTEHNIERATRAILKRMEERTRARLSRRLKPDLR